MIKPTKGYKAKACLTEFLRKSSTIEIANSNTVDYIKLN